MSGTPQLPVHTPEEWRIPAEYNPFDEVEILPGLGIAVLWVVLSYVLKGYTTEEVGKALNDEGIAVRSGHHCAQPILRRMGVETTVRPSLAFYNTCEEVDRMIAVVRRLSSARRH